MPDKFHDRRIPYFGDFVLFDEIGRGGMGVVYNAQQTKLDRPVALKVLHSIFGACEGGIQRLRVEAEATARLDHPNIVRVFEFGEHEGHPYLAMQLVEGKSLAEHIHRCGSDFNDKDVALLMGKIARAVHHAHQRGVLHRDLKPGNILLDDSGEPHLIDFGLAKCVERESRLTQTGAFLGTPAYASPEQAAGQNKSVTTASDIYSLGAILYVLLTGQPPFVGESTAETIEKVKSGALLRPRSVQPTISTNLETICLKCLEKEPARRYASALELAKDLERFLDGKPISARPVGPLERTWMWARRNPAHAGLGIALSLLVLASVIGVLLWRAKDREVRSKLLQTRADAAETQSQILRRSLFLEQIQKARLTPHREGWTGCAWSDVNAAAKIPTTVKSDDLRNQAVALLGGLDAHLVVPFTSFGASSVVFDRNGRRLLVGGLGNGAKLWDGKSGEPAHSAHTNSMALAFANDVPVELHYDRNTRSLVLGDFDGLRKRREWKIPEQVDSIKVAANAPVLPVITPDGDYVATVLALADGRQAVIVSHTNTFEPVGVYPAPVKQLAISPDGSLVAVAQLEKRISVWSVSDRSRVADLAFDRIEVLCLAFARATRVPLTSHSGKDGGWLLAAGDSGGNVTLWDLNNQTAKTHYRGGHYGVCTVAISPDGTILASGGRGPVKLWDLATEQLLLDIRVGGAGQYITGLDFAPDGKRLAISMREAESDANHVVIAELEFGRGIQSLRGLSSQIAKVCFSADGQKVAALSHDWEVGIWDLATGQLRRVFEVPAGEFGDNAALALDLNGERMAFAASKEAKMWHVKSGVVSNSWSLWRGLGDGLSFPDEKHLLLGRAEALKEKSILEDARKMGGPYVFRIRNLLNPDWHRPLTEDPEFDLGVSNTTESRDGRYFVVEGKQSNASEFRRIIKAYDGFTGKGLWRVVSTRTNASGTMPIDPSGRFIAFHSEDGLKASMVELSSGSRIKLLPWMPDAIGPAGGYFTVRESARGFLLFKDTDPIPIVSLGIDGGDSSALPQFDPTGNKLAWGNTEGTVIVCNLKEINEQLRRVQLQW